MYFFYLNDSSDPVIHTFSALGVPDKNLHALQSAVKNYRLQLKKNAGIFISKELDAAKFVAGKGHPSNRKLSKKRRCRIFSKALSFLTTQKTNDIVLLNTALNNQALAFTNLIRDINYLMQSRNETAILFCDETKIKEYARLNKQFRITDIVSDPDELDAPVSIKTFDNILEDFIFKPAAQSNLIQLAGFCAYALLREKNPVDTKSELGIDVAFKALNPICVNVEV